MPKHPPELKRLMAEQRERRKKEAEKGPDRRGRPPLENTVKIMTRGPKLDQAWLDISEDIIIKLLTWRDKVVEYSSPLRPMTLLGLRMQFTTLAADRIPGVFMRIEPPTFYQQGARLHRLPKRRSFYLTAPCRALGLDNGVMTKTVELLWMPDIKGVLLLFEDGDMAFATDPARSARDYYASQIEDPA